MDKFITFIGYIQNYVAPSRRNGNPERADTNSSWVKSREHLPAQNEPRAKEALNINKDSTHSGLNSNNGGPSNEDFEEEDASKEADRKILRGKNFFRGKVKEARFPRARYTRTFVQNEQAKSFAGAESCRSEATLPPVETTCQNINVTAAQNITSTGAKAATGETSATRPEEQDKSAGNRTTLYSGYNAAKNLCHEQKTHQRSCLTKGDQGNKDLRGRNDLPDIFSTEGKPLVQLKQRSIPYVPVGRKPTCVVADTLEQVNEDFIPPDKSGRKSRLKLPKLKRKSKKQKKGASDHPSETPTEQDGNVFDQESLNPSKKGDRLESTVSICGPEEGVKLSEENTNGAKRSKKQTRRRPGTALGRWLKKRSNSVAPAPCEDLTCDSSGEGLVLNSVAPAPCEDATCDSSGEGLVQKSVKGTFGDSMANTDEKATTFKIDEPFINTPPTQHCTQKVDKKAPEPFDVTSDSCSERLAKKESSDDNLPNGNEKKGEASMTDEPVLTPCRIILVSEKKENVSVSLMREDAYKDKESTPTNESNAEVVSNESEPATETKTTTAGFVKEEREMSATRSDKLEEELHTGNKSSEAPSNPKQKPISASDRNNDQQSLQPVCAERGEKLNRKKNKLITLEIKGGVLDPPAVSRKNYGSVPCKSGSVKQRVTKICTPVTLETKPGISVTQKNHDEWGFNDTDRESTLREVPQVEEQLMKKKVKRKKKMRLTIEQGAFGGAPDTVTNNPMYFTGSHRQARKPSTFIQQFEALTRNDCVPGPSNQHPHSPPPPPPPPLPDCKPKWHGAGPCLPSILPDKKQRVEDFLAKHRKKQELKQEEDFEGWGEPESEEVKCILGRPLTVKSPRYPEHWTPLPNDRPPGRGGKGYCLGVIWKKPEKSFLSDSSSEDLSELANKQEEPDVFPRKAGRCETPRKSVFTRRVNYSLPACEFEEPVTWCSASRVRRPSAMKTLNRKTTQEDVNLEDVE